MPAQTRIIHYYVCLGAAGGKEWKVNMNAIILSLISWFVFLINPPIGSTIPDKAPYTNDFHLLIPSCLSGREIAAPSGKFCIAIPMAKANEAIIVIVELPLAAKAKHKPTDMPSGIL